MLHARIFLTLCFPLLLASKAPEKTRTGSRSFTSSVYKQVAGNETGNFVFSSFSVRNLMALVEMGARGQTAKEIIKGLHLPGSEKKIRRHYRSLKEKFGKKKIYVIRSANMMFLNEAVQLSPKLKKIATSDFGSEVENLFFGASKEAAKFINNWVANRTEHRIQNIIKSSDLKLDTVAVLINALYFKGNWSIGFYNETTKRNFFVDGKRSVEVDTMETIQSAFYYNCNKLKAQFFQLPFEGRDVAMTFVLPNSKTGLTALEEDLGRVFQTPNYTKEALAIFLPKFKSETLLNFKDILRKLGIKKVFSDRAELDGMLKFKSNIKVDEMFQKSFISVDEHGVEAAAATKTHLWPKYTTKTLKMDHPFIYYITFGRVILFAGRVVDPTK